MTDTMRWFYTHYIGPQIENQPKDAAEEMFFDLLDNDLPPYLNEAMESANKFYAVQGFRLGLKMGIALEGDLRG